MIKTINTNEEIPEVFYIFLEFGNTIFDFVNKHNYEIDKTIRSAGINNLFLPNNAKSFINGDIDYLPFISNKITTFSPSTFMLKIINNYNVEYNLELCRKINYKTYPSRLSGIYEFGDYESCIKVSEKYGWDITKVKKFKLVDLGELNQFIKIGKFNMEIVSLLRGINVHSFSIEEQDYLYKMYWEGAGSVSVDIPMGLTEITTVESGVIYEYLIEGVLEEIES